MRTKVWWPGIDQQVENYIKECYECQLVSKPQSPEPLLSTSLPVAPWVDIACDHFGPFGSSNNYLLVVIDYYSRYFECRVVKSTDTQTTIQVLDEIFQVHGLPKSLKSDSGPAFISHEFRKFCENLDIKHSRGTPRWPQGNGLAESCMKSIKKRLQIAVTTGRDWRIELQKYLFSYRTTSHPATGKSPAELLFGRKLRTKIPDFSAPGSVDDSEVREHDAVYKAKAKKYADFKRKAKPACISIGDEVLVKRDQLQHKTDTLFYPDVFVVTDVKGSQITVKSQDGREYKRNCSHLRTFKRAHEIIQPPFVGTDAEKREGDYHEDNDDNYADRYSTPTSIRKSSRKSYQPDRYKAHYIYTEQHCPLHCCFEGSEREYHSCG